MMQLLREFRILPVVLFAAICLLSLKVIGIVRGSGYVLTDEPFLGEILNTRISEVRSAERKPVETAEAKPAVQDVDITGSVDTKPAEKPATPPANKPLDPPKDSGGKAVMIDQTRPSSPAERALLERLQERRQEIDGREREMEIRDGMIKAAEMKLEARIAELKAMEARVATAMQAKDDADTSRFKGLVSMYENMKPKDAAKIFDRLDLTILVQVVSLINPRKMSDILANMSAENAERLTVELAARANGTDKVSGGPELPKIQGQPGG